MTVPNMLTSLRIILSPIFLFFFFADTWIGIPVWVSVVVTVIIFGMIEISDLLDGYYARKLNQATDVGKMLDPFSDSLSRLTYFLCFTVFGRMPLWVFCAVLYRDLGVAFIRQLMARRGTAMAARWGGKLKALVYAASGLFGLGVISLTRLSLLPVVLPVLNTIVDILFVITAATAVWTLIDYASALRIQKSG